MKPKRPAVDPFPRSLLEAQGSQPGHQKYLTYWPFWLMLEVLGHCFTYFYRGLVGFYPSFQPKQPQIC